MSQAAPKIEFATERPKLVAGRDQTVGVLIRIIPPEPEAVAGRRPALNLSLVLDRSGSMKGVKMERALEAAAYGIDELLPTDRLSVVIFDDQIEVLIPSQCAENKADLKERLARVFTRNSTALHEAWVRGGIQVSEHLDGEAINRVLLITDGRANVGLTGTDEIVSQAGELCRRGVSTSTIGIGDDFNEDLLLPMAQAAGGNAWHVERADDLPRIFAVELGGLIAQVAHTVSLGLIPSDGIRLVDVLNDFELTETGRYRLPDLQAGSPLEIVAQFRVPAQPQGTRLRLFDLRLGFTPQEAKSAQVLKAAFEVEFDDEVAVEQSPVDPEVAKAVRLLMNARARREAVACMDQGDFAAARRVVGIALGATGKLRAQLGARGSNDPGVQAEQQALEHLCSALENRQQDKGTRKRLSYEAYSRQHSKHQP
jgi:Ca-activated chloride channel family protein